MKAFAGIVLLSIVCGFPLESETNIRKINPEEVANGFEGDIVLPNTETSRSGRNGLADSSKRWPKNVYGQVTVPFKIDGRYSSSDLNLINSAINEIQQKTCVRFTPRTSERDYIDIVSKSGCSSYVGRSGGKQEVSLGSSSEAAHCMVKGIIIHELLHALGFYHMHSSADRDNFVKINYQNIIWGLSYAFSKSNSNSYGTRYDLDSVMHYDPFYFSNNGKPTIEPIDTSYLTNKKMGQRVGLSPGDVTRINNMYQC